MESWMKNVICWPQTKWLTGYLSWLMKMGMVSVCNGFWQLKMFHGWFKTCVGQLWHCEALIVKLYAYSLLLVYIKRIGGCKLCNGHISGMKKYILRITQRITVLRHLGELSLDEFIDGARRDKWVMKMLQMDVNPGDWLNERRRSADF